MTLRAHLLVCLCAICFAAETVPPAADGTLVSFGPGFDATKLPCSGTTVAMAGTPEAPALRVTTKAHAFWPGVTIPAPKGGWDLSPYLYLSIDIRNVDTHDMDVFLRVDNPGGRNIGHRVGVQPDQRVTMNMVIERRSQSKIKLFGMHGYPPDLANGGGLDPSQVIALVLFTAADAATDCTFEITGIRAFGSYKRAPWADMDEAAFFPFIDRYGQFRHKEWPGKTHADADLQARRAEEATELAASPAPAEWDRFGGWAAGPQLEATGHFRTAKHEGKWWLVDPDGRLFFSVGLTCVGYGSGPAPLDKRDAWFELPAAGDPLAKYLTGAGGDRGYNHAAANLERKYGADWRSGYPDLVHRRLRAWGINTIANWSDGGICMMKRTPYVRTFFYDIARLKGGKANFPDMLDPGFAASLDRGAKQFLAGSADDPWCLGYFLDNEMPWGGDETLARYALESPATQAAKRRLQAWLQERYPDIAKLNAAWGTAWAGWDAFAADTAGKTAAGAHKDLVDFTGVMAEAYFSEVLAAMRRFAPHKLYLGCRCVGGSDNVIAAAVKNCDVISYNRYCASVRDITLPNGHDKPVMIGEFHFGGIDRGLFWSGLFSAEDQEDRGRKLAGYIASGLANPQIVGVHWFQYADQQTTGRSDGENGQIGFVDVCDNPYVETVRAARASAETMYRRRAGK